MADDGSTLLAGSARVLGEQHARNARWYLRFRVVAVTGWMCVDYLFGSLRPDLAAAVPYLMVFLAVGAMLLAASIRWPIVVEHSWWASAVIDMPFAFAIQYQGVFKAPSSQEAAAFAMGLFAAVVVLSFLSLRRRHVVATTVVAIFLEAIVLDAGQTHAGAIAGSSLVLATIGTTGAWLVERIGRLAETIAIAPEMRRIAVSAARLDLEGPRELTMLCAGVSDASSRDEVQTMLVKMVVSHGGLLDRVAGSAVIASFGADGDPEHVAMAIRCALDISAASQDVNERRRLRGERPMRLGVGLATGTVVIGSNGSAERRDYTAMGEAVATATRLQGLAGDAQSAVFCSARTQALAAGSYEWSGVPAPVPAFVPTQGARSQRGQAG